VAGCTDDLRAGVDLAQSSIQNGQALNKLEALATLSQSLSAGGSAT